jgi:hypothetical protein
MLVGCRCRKGLEKISTPFSQNRCSASPTTITSSTPYWILLVQWQSSQSDDANLVA